MEHRNIARHLPLTEPTFYILVALLQPQHGYAVMQDVGQMSGGRVHLGPGTLYGALTKLEESKLIKKVGEVERRKIYLITEKGQEVLRGQLDRSEVMVQSAKERFKRAIV